MNFDKVCVYIGYGVVGILLLFIVSKSILFQFRIVEGFLGIGGKKKAVESANENDQDDKKYDDDDDDDDDDDESDGDGESDEESDED